MKWPETRLSQTSFLSANPIPNILQKTSLIGAKFYHEKNIFKNLV